MKLDDRKEKVLELKLHVIITKSAKTEIVRCYFEESDVLPKTI